MVLYKETLSPEMMELLLQLMRDENLKIFYLAGGTALSLQIGHRNSIDIDLFTHGEADKVQIKKGLTERYPADTTKFEKEGIVVINNIKVDIVVHRYPLIRPLREEDGIRMASVEDISAMKIKVITDQGTREKDFADLYCLLEKNSLKNLVAHYIKKYPDVTVHMVVRSMRNFTVMKKGRDISLLHEKYDWNKVKRRLEQAMLFPGKKFGKSRGLRP